MMRFVLGLL